MEKTTFIDLMLGLLKPKSGIIKIDDKLLDDTSVDSWQNNCVCTSKRIFD